MCIGKRNVFFVMLFAFVGLWLGITDKAFPDQIKTIDDRVVEGKVVHVDGEYISATGKRRHLLHSVAHH